ncbi:MAG: hypothetical protein ACHBN1_16200 [Heteroscytonema crispum UTEX LB 1556]
MGSRKQPPTINYQTLLSFTSRLGRENATATLGQTPRPQWLPYQGRPFTTNHQPPTPSFFHQSPGSGKRHCDPWPDPKTAVAPLPRARSEPGGIFPTVDFAPLHHQPITTQ